MTFTEAAVAVLRLVGKPLHYKEITDVAIERSMLSHVGKSPEVTMGARLAAQVKKTEKDNPIQRVKPGVFALAEWTEQEIEDGLSDRTPALEKLAKRDREKGTSPEEAGLSSGVPQDSSVLSESSTAAPVAAHRELDADTAPPDEEEQHRAELSAAASELFESEDDDDQPIFGDKAGDIEESNDQDDRHDGKKRRRRRRGRGRRDDEVSSDDSGDDMPTYTVSDAEPEELPRAEELTNDLQGDAEDSAAFVVALQSCLNQYDRSKGPVAAQNIADALRRKGRGDVNLSGAAVIAVAVADNLACERKGLVPQFRVNGNKLALRSWGQDKKVQEREKLLTRAAQQYEEAVVRALSEELRKLPQRAVGELVLVLAERMGVSNLASIRRPGAHGSELHLSGELSLGTAVKTPLAILIRRDGKDIGRERVTELRGGMHHYGNAVVGWVVSTGQVLSGAKEEAQSSGASPVTLIGRSELAELCLKHGVGVRMSHIEVPSLDVDLFEGLLGR